MAGSGGRGRVARGEEVLQDVSYPGDQLGVGDRGQRDAERFRLREGAGAGVEALQADLPGVGEVRGGDAQVAADGDDIREPRLDRDAPQPRDRDEVDDRLGKLAV